MEREASGLQHRELIQGKHISQHSSPVQAVSEQMVLRTPRKRGIGARLAHQPMQQLSADNV
eukprot:824750-Pelagomonas_calceolata.AAC.7